MLQKATFWIPEQTYEYFCFKYHEHIFAKFTLLKIFWSHPALVSSSSLCVLWTPLLFLWIIYTSLLSTDDNIFPLHRKWDAKEKDFRSVYKSLCASKIFQKEGLVCSHMDSRHTFLECFASLWYYHCRMSELQDEVLEDPMIVNTLMWSKLGRSHDKSRTTQKHLYLFISVSRSFWL